MLRVLVGYEDSHRSYGEALAASIWGSRPRAEVTLVQVRGLGPELRRLDPHVVVVCGQPNTVDPGGRGAWIRLSEDPDEPSEVCLAGRRRRVRNPGMEELLAVIDEAEELVVGGRGDDLGGC